MQFRFENHLGHIILSVQLKEKKAGVTYSQYEGEAWITYFVLTDQDHQKAVSAKSIITSAKSLFQKTKGYEDERNRLNEMNHK